MYNAIIMTSLCLALTACANTPMVTVMHNPHTGDNVQCQHVGFAFDINKPDLDQCVNGYAKLGYQAVQ